MHCIIRRLASKRLACYCSKLCKNVLYFKICFSVTFNPAKYLALSALLGRLNRIQNTKNTNTKYCDYLSLFSAEVMYHWASLASPSASAPSALQMTHFPSYFIKYVKWLGISEYTRQIDGEETFQP